MLKRIIISLSVIIIMSVAINLLLYSISYHEQNDIPSILSIDCTSSNKHITYNTNEDIKEFEHKLRGINFYPAHSEYLPESPEYSITITYENGNRKHINIIGFNAMMAVQIEKESVIKELTKFYYVNPLDIYLLFY